MVFIEYDFPQLYSVYFIKILIIQLCFFVVRLKNKRIFNLQIIILKNNCANHLVIIANNFLTVFTNGIFDTIIICICLGVVNIFHMLSQFWHKDTTFFSKH